MDNKKLLPEEINGLMETGDFNQVTTLLTDSLLEKEKDSKLYFYCGWAYLQLNDVVQARKYLELANQLDTELKRNFLLSGIELHNKGLFENAIKEYEKAIALDNTYPDAFYNRGLAYYDLKDFEKAIADCKTAIMFDAYYPNPHILLGLSYYSTGNYSEAITHYTKAIEFDAHNGLHYYNRGLAWYFMMDYNKAIHDFEKALLLIPDYTNAYLYRGLAYYNKGDYDSAIADYNTAILKIPDNSNFYFNRGLAYYNKGDYKNAVTDFTKTIELSENDYFAYNQRGLSWYYLADLDKAVADFNMAIKINPSFASAYHSMGLYWLYKSEYHKAIAEFDKTIELDENYIRAYYNRGLCWYYLFDYEKAIADYNKAIELDPDYYDAYFNRGLAYYYKREYDKAIPDYDVVILSQPAKADARLNRGLAWYYLGEYEKAIADYDEVLSLKTEFSESAYINRGIAYYYKGQYNEAIEDYTSALEINDKTEYVYNNRGLAWFNKGYFNEAIEDYNKAIGLKSVYPDTFNNRGMAWYEKGEFEKAIEDCTKALELDESFADAYNTRGTAFFELKNFNAAEEDFRKVSSFTGYEAIGNTYIGDVYSARGEFQKAGEFYSKAEKEPNIPNWLVIPLKQKIERNNLRLGLLRANIPLENLVNQVFTESRIERTLQKIRKIARSDAKNVVHYTKLSVADIYVSSVYSKMHYSNAIYMNDPMEGQVFFDYLDDIKITQAYLEGEKRDESSVYLGSFLPAEDSAKGKSHEDELVMWRTYGKDENGREAAGCNIVLSTDFFKPPKKPAIRKFSNTEIEKDQLNLAVFKEEYSKNKTGDEELLNVIYLDFQNQKGHIRNDPSGNLKPAMEELKRLLNELIEMSKKSGKKEFSKFIENTIFKQLSTISFLFKSADYIYENEVRVIKYVPRNSDLIKPYQVDLPGLPRKKFYVESNNEILPFIRKIHLGPKVEKHQQWSLYFDFEIRKRAKELAEMENPPFELQPSEIEILKSGCKFQ